MFVKDKISHNILLCQWVNLDKIGKEQNIYFKMIIIRTKINIYCLHIITWLILFWHTCYHKLVIRWERIVRLFNHFIILEPLFVIIAMVREISYFFSGPSKLTVFLVLWQIMATMFLKWQCSDIENETDNSTACKPFISAAVTSCGRFRRAKFTCSQRSSSPRLTIT